jgi:hypothetical protein
MGEKQAVNPKNRDFGHGFLECELPVDPSLDNNEEQVEYEDGACSAQQTGQSR